MTSEFTAQKKKYFIEKNPDIAASYIEGQVAFEKFIADNLDYPKSALKEAVEGVVIIGFVIERDGSVSGKQILQNVGFGCGVEAARILSLVESWSPALKNKKKVRSKYEAKILFELPSDYKNCELKGISEEDIDKLDHTAPEMMGGNKAFPKYLQQNIRYPDLAMEENIQGKVVVRFLIEKDGSITNVQIVKGIGGGCDLEAIRIINNMPKWKPGIIKEEKVATWYSLPINFKLQ